MTVCDDTKDENATRHVATTRSDNDDLSIMRAVLDEELLKTRILRVEE